MASAPNANTRPKWQTALMWGFGVLLAILVSLWLIKHTWFAIVSVPPTPGDSVAIRPHQVVTVTDVPAITHDIVSGVYAAPIVRILGNTTGQTGTVSADPNDDSVVPQCPSWTEEYQTCLLTNSGGILRRAPWVSSKLSICLHKHPVDPGATARVFMGDFENEPIEVVAGTPAGPYDHIKLTAKGTVEFRYKGALHCPK